ncbi:MAG: acyl-CoA dehydrogenase family protein [Chloroflexota bacterium]|nr:acyl-CoA dehydrogenase family protein [Chloroflexota bacterium]
MDFNFNEEQEMLRRMARDFLTEECPKSLVREMISDEKGYYPELWRKMAELGWMGLMLPEKYGGSGGGFLDLIVLLEEMGRACLLGPFFSSVVLGSSIVIEAGDEIQKQDLLPLIAKGDIIITLALTEASVDYNPASVSVRAKLDKDEWIIDGTKLFVPDAHIADHIICVCRSADSMGEDGITLLLVNAKSPGISVVPLQSFTGDKQCEVIFDKVRVPQQSTIGEVNKGWEYIGRLLQKAAVAKCAQMLGGAQQVLEMTIAYAKERVQFGRPIGSFQAIQHHCSNMMTDIEGSRLLTYRAAWMLTERLPCAKEVTMAKAWVTDAYKRVTILGHQAQGGVSVMEDHDMPLYSKQMASWGPAFGDATFHRKMLGQAWASE